MGFCWFNEITNFFLFVYFFSLSI